MVIIYVPIEGVDKKIELSQREYAKKLVGEGWRFLGDLYLHDRSGQVVTVQIFQKEETW